MKTHSLVVLFLALSSAAPACSGVELPDVGEAFKSPALSVSAPEAKDGAGFGKPGEAGPGDPADALMHKLSVLTVMSGYKPEDSANLQKVSEALLSATPDMWVHVTEPLSETSDRYDFVAAPQDSYEIPGEFPKKTEKKSALSKYGGDIVGVITWNSAELDFNIYPGYPGPVAVNTTGLVWQVKASCVFVTLDGGRYHIPCRYLGKGLPHAVDWPAPLRHSLLTPMDVKKLAEMGTLPKATGAELEAAKGDWESCIKKAGAPAKAEFDKIDTAKTDAATRRTQGDQIVEKYRPKQQAACQSKFDKIGSILVKTIETRSAERKALYEKVVAKVGGSAKK